MKYITDKKPMYYLMAPEELNMWPTYRSLDKAKQMAQKQEAEGIECVIVKYMGFFKSKHKYGRF